MEEKLIFENYENMGTMGMEDPAAALIEQHKVVFNEGMKAREKGDIDLARTKFFEAAELCSLIARKSNNATLQVEYKKLSGNILKFISENLTQKTQSAEGSVNKSQKFTPVSADQKTIKMKDVAGLDDVKEEIYYKAYKPIINPILADKYKIKAGSKILLYGPPGTGKTHIAKAIAGTIDANFYVINCQDLISPYLGDSSKKINELFEQIKNDDRAIIFFDEFDAIAPKRKNGGEIDSEMSRAVATLLSKIDGFNKKNGKNKMLMLVAATNKPMNIDPAMLRGGRFDTQIYVGPPEFEARKQMIQKAFEGVPVDEDFSVDAMATALEGFGGGDIVSACEKIRLEAYKRATKNQGVVRISLADCKKGLSRQRNSITQQMKQECETFKNQVTSNSIES